MAGRDSTPGDNPYAAPDVEPPQQDPTPASEPDASPRRGGAHSLTPSGGSAPGAGRGAPSEDDAAEGRKAFLLAALSALALVNGPELPLVAAIALTLLSLAAALVAMRRGLRLWRRAAAAKTSPGWAAPATLLGGLMLAASSVTAVSHALPEARQFRECHLGASTPTAKEACNARFEEARREWSGN